MLSLLAGCIRLAESEGNKPKAPPRRELLVLVTPWVIRDTRGALDIANELRQRMEDLERLEAKVAPKQEDRAEDEPEERPEDGPAAE